ncbi:MAG: hypothetical protein R3F61_31005 [Myxococcota bacterium]
MVDDLAEPAWTVSTKKKAVAAAVPTARELGARLVIETRTGGVQRTHDFTNESPHQEA